jgi:fatty-acyl-CoA synthase
MKGYYNLPDSTRQVIDDEGWFYTGDLATIDQQGYIRIVGRKKDMIIRGGYNIYPNELEEKFCTHPAVRDAAIVGLPDSVLGEVSCAAIVLKPDCMATAGELKTFIKKQVADYKVTDHIVFMESLPKTASDKTQKFLLKDTIINNKIIPLR